MKRWLTLERLNHLEYHGRSSTASWTTDVSVATVAVWMKWMSSWPFLPSLLEILNDNYCVSPPSLLVDSVADHVALFNCVLSKRFSGYGVENYYLKKYKKGKKKKKKEKERRKLKRIEKKRIVLKGTLKTTWYEYWFEFLILRTINVSLSVRRVDERKTKQNKTRNWCLFTYVDSDY